MIKKMFGKITDFIVGEIGILLLSIFISVFIVFVMWMIICENGLIKLESVEIYNEIWDVYITCIDENNPFAGFYVDRTYTSDLGWGFTPYQGNFVITYLSYIIFLLLTVWNVSYGLVNGVFNLLYGNNKNKEIFEEFKTPEYDVVLRAHMLYDCISIKETQKKLIEVKEEKEKNKDNLNEVNENLIFSNIDEDDELYKLVMNYKWTINKTKEQKQFDDIHILMNKRMREHGLIKRYTINDFIMMFGVEKIDKEEFISWCKRIIIEIIALLFVLKLSQLINEVLWNVVSIIVILYVIGRMIHVPYTKKFYEERKKINTYNKMYNEKWGK